MSMPKFPDKDKTLTRDEALDAILTSIAMEEIALSRILNAEADKIQFAIEYIKNHKCDPTILLKINESADSLIGQINDMQIILKSKLKLVLDIIERDCPPTPPHPPRPPKPPEPPKPRSFEKGEFVAANVCWRKTLNLALIEKSYDKIRLHNNMIFLPKNKKYVMDLHLKLVNPISLDISVDVTLFDSKKIMFCKTLKPKDLKGMGIINESIGLSTGGSDCFVSIKLDCTESIKVEDGFVKVVVQ